MAESIITLANSRMTITEACRLVGVHIGDFTLGSMKTYCPFGGVFHTDGGWSKAFRIYPGTNSAYCFACGAHYTPVKLIARARDLSDEDAAQWILDQTNYVPPDFASRWDALTKSVPEIDRDALAEALSVACARAEPQWEERQFDPEVAASLRRCLDMLPRVTSADAAKRWLATCTQFMQRVLGGERV